MEVRPRELYKALMLRLPVDWQNVDGNNRNAKARKIKEKCRVEGLMVVSLMVLVIGNLL